jgi:hypothetical protein
LEDQQKALTDCINKLLASSEILSSNLDQANGSSIDNGKAINNKLNDITALMEQHYININDELEAKQKAAH